MNKVILAVILVLSAWCVIATSTCNSERKSKAVISYAAKHTSDTDTHWFDQYKSEHDKRVAVEGSLNELQVSYEADIDTATKRLQIGKRQIEGLQNLLANATGNFTAVVIHDTDVQKFYYKDSSIQEHAVISDDTAHISYDVTLPIHLAQYWHRPWLLGKKTHYVDGYSDAPNVHITDLKSIRVGGKEPGRFGVGPYVGISLNGPSIGIALTYSLLRF